MKNLKAFTLIEILVAMTLTALLSTFSFQAFQLVKQQFRLHQKMNQEANDHQHFIRLLNHDFQQAQFVERYHNQLVCANGTDDIWYEIGADFVSRNHRRLQTIRDTFPIKVDILQTFFQAKELESGLVDACLFKIQLFKEPRDINIVKNYSASDLINYQTQ